MQDSVKLKQAIQKLQRQMPRALESETGSGGAGDMPPTAGSPFPVPTPIPVPPSPSAVNQIRNGELGHSWDTAVNPPPGLSTADLGKECWYWYSHLAPFSTQLLNFTDARVDPANNTLKAYINDGGTHTRYNAAYSDWDRSKGEARFQGSTSLDAPFPSNRTVANNRKVEYLGALIARRNSTIVIQSDNHIYCGLWDNSVALPDWIKGTLFVVNYRIRGNPVSTTERKYKVYAFTDRGYTYLSAELTIIDAPSEAAFADSDVYLSWKAIPGILQYWIYRFDVVDNQYHLLKQIGSGTNNYGDNGRVEVRDVGGYPAATYTTPIAYIATREHQLDNVAVDGDPWTPLTLAPAVPDDYDMAATTGEQVLRLGMTKALDRMMIDAISTAGSAPIESDTGEFTTLDTGRTATLLDADGNILHGPEVITFIDTTHVAFATNVATGNIEAALYILEGGDHGLLIDAIHVSYVAGAAFAAYPDDLNRLENGGQNPIAAPNHSSQGGSGGGGGVEPGDGEVGCVTLDCPVNVWVGNTLETWPWRAVRIGEYLFSGDLRASRVLAKPRPAGGQTDNLHLLRVRASWLYDIELPCSPQQPVITEQLDGIGRAVQHLKPEGHALISIDGHVKQRKIREIIATGKEAETGIFTLTPSKFFSAGYVHYRTPIHRMIGWILRKLRRRAPVVGIILHNRKNEQNQI